MIGNIQIWRWTICLTNPPHVLENNTQLIGLHSNPNLRAGKLALEVQNVALDSDFSIGKESILGFDNSFDGTKSHCYTILAGEIAIFLLSTHRKNTKTI